MSEEVKMAIKKQAVKVLRIIIIAVTVTILIASLFVGAVKKLYDNVSEVFNDILDNIKISGDNLEIDSDYLSKGKKRLKAMGISADSLGLKGHEDYLTRFLEAEIVTSYPYLGGSGLQGTVYFERAGCDGNTKELKYLPYDQFYAKKDSDDIFDYFTIDTKDWTAHIKKNDGTIEKINYKSMVSKFGMPFEFPVALAQVTQNPQFCLAVVKLVKKSKIVITIAESKTTVVTHKTINYNMSSELRKNDGTVEIKNTNVPGETKLPDETTETYSTDIFLSRAQTWIVNYGAPPKYDKSQEDEPTIETELDDYTNKEELDDGTYYTYYKNRKQTQTGTRYYQRWIRGVAKVVEKSDRFTNLILRKSSILGADGIVEVAKRCHDAIADSGRFSYGATSGGIPIDVTKDTHVDCSGYVSWVLYEAGYEEMAGGQHSTANSSLGQFGKDKGWDVITDYSEIQPGDICFWRGTLDGNDPGHVNIFVETDGKSYYFYDCGDQSAINAKDPIQYDMSEFGYAFRPNDEIAQALSVAPTTDKLKEKIEKFIDGISDGKYSVSYADINESSNKANINNEKVQSDGWIKLFIMATTFGEIEAGNLKWDDVKAEVESMITVDDNSNANILLKNIGNGDISKGIEKVNYFASHNYIKATKLTKELSGTVGETGEKGNYTTAANVSGLLEKILSKKCISKAASEKMIEILQAQNYTDIIPTQITDGTVGNKTGEQTNKNSVMVQDAAIVSIEKANYVVAISASDVSSTEEAKTNIKKIAKMINDYFEKYGTLNNNKNAEQDDEIQTILNGKRVCYRMPDGRWICPLSNLVEGRKLLFETLARKEKTQNYERLMRYLMYLLTGHDYGVTEFDFNEFIFGSFNEAGGIYGNTTEEKVWWALIGAGYSKEAAAGVLGNIYAESGFNAAVIEHGNGIGLGLCQWSYGRRTQLEGYAASKGVQASDINTQIEFLLGELTPGGGAGGFANYQMGGGMNGYTVENWKNASSPEDAAIAFCWVFERPGIPRMEIRTEAARRYYEQFKDAQKPSGSDGTGTEMQNKIVQLASSKDTFGQKQGYCQAWVAAVYSKAGQQWVSAPCATEAASKWVVSQDRNNIPLGATVYGHAYIDANGRQAQCYGHEAGHVGIYVGNGQVASNVGGIQIESLDSWISTYGWKGWGWNGGTDYSK